VIILVVDDNQALYLGMLSKPGFNFLFPGPIRKVGANGVKGDAEVGGCEESNRVTAPGRSENNVGPGGRCKLLKPGDEVGFCEIRELARVRSGSVQDAIDVCMMTLIQGFLCYLALAFSVPWLGIANSNWPIGCTKLADRNWTLCSISCRGRLGGLQGWLHR